MFTLTSDAAERVRQHIDASIETKRKLLESGAVTILEAARAMGECLAAGGKILLCGNGGSAADAQHIASEFVSVLDHRNPRPPLAAIALTTDSSFLTANANDFGFEGVFERQVQALGRAGDVLIGISTSGSSKNVLRAVGYARANGIRTIAMTRVGHSALAGAAEIVLGVPSRVTAYIQESHIMIGHILCELVERSFASSQTLIEKTS
jgi:D-sedoheptulose 7-phosphate isomerase